MLSFKRIEIIGFKSFADKTIIEFDSGITAIIGPNGCGKSNIADCIRWVLGEQSSKQLRGNNMQEVIFSGTDKRKPLNYCEVTLVLDNSSRTIDIDYDEVAFTRKLYRTGQSEYLINKNLCNLKDITNILHDSGIGKEGYSIIGQDRVKEIINSKPSDRRGIFEEAAGISKYKKQKKDSEKKLANTRENLTRIDDIIGEIERQLNPMRKQAEKAIKFLAYNEKLKKYEINNYIYNYDSASERKSVIDKAIKGYEEEIENRMNDIKETTENHSKVFKEFTSIDGKIRNLYDRISNIKVEVEKKSGAVGILKEKISSQKEELSRLENQILEIKTINEKNISTKEEYLQEKEIAEKEIADLKKENVAVNEKYGEIANELTKSELADENNQKELFSNLTELGDLKAKISAGQAEIKSLQNKNIEIDENNKILSEKRQQLKDENSKLNDVKKKLDAEIENLTNEINKALKEYNEAIYLRNQYARDEVNFNSSISSLETRKKILQDMIESEGYVYSVKRILEAKKKNAFTGDFVGVVANLINVEEKYQVAVEMSLGGAIQNIVTKNEDDAKNIISYLKSNNLGRATFLPITSVKPKNLNSNQISLIKSHPDCYGIASELVTFDKSIRNVIDSLLGATVIVKDLVTAISLAKKSSYSFKIVTLDGDVVNSSGSMSGGSKKNNISNLLGRENELQEVKANLEKLQKQNEENKNNIKNNNEKIQSLDVKIKQSNIVLNNKKMEDAKCVEQLKTILENIENLNSNIQINENNILENEEKLNELRNEIVALESVQNSNSSMEDMNANLEERQKKVAKLRQMRDEYNETKTKCQVNIAMLESKLQGINANIERVVADTEFNLIRLSEMEANFDKVKKSLFTLENQLSNQTDNAINTKEKQQLQNLEEKLSKQGEEKERLENEIHALDEKKNRLNNELNKLSDKKYAEELKLTKIDTDIENMQERIWAAYELSYAGCQEYKEEDYDINEGLKQANKYKRDIDNLGYVNVNAIEDIKDLEERYEKYTTESEDVRKAEADLTKVIKELSNEMTTRFENAFNIINKNFKEIFKEIFGGGEAELVLTPNEDDPLEKGVEIIARPPGVKLSNIRLLSGGESALTAISILFAILKLRPMPFCLLDEVEAALDDANVYRFAKYLGRFSSGTQFIVITHRKPTMQLADNLYGVTMQEKGVSNIVSVNLSDVDFVEEGEKNGNNSKN